MTCAPRLLLSIMEESVLNVDDIEILRTNINVDIRCRSNGTDFNRNENRLVQSLGTAAESRAFANKLICLARVPAF